MKIDNNAPRRGVDQITGGRIMFCGKCGTPVSEGNAFCARCGAPVGGAQEQKSSLSQSQNLRKESLEEIDRMISYFGEKQALYDEYDNCVGQILYYSDPSSDVKLDKPEFVLCAKGKNSVYLGLITIICGLMVWIGSWPEPFTDGELVNTIFSIIGFSIVIAGFVWMCIGIHIRKNYNRSYRKYLADTKREKQAERERLIKHYEERRHGMVYLLNEYYKNYGYCPIAAEYTNPKILKKIREPIYIGRADTIKEAMNLLFAENH